MMTERFLPCDASAGLASWALGIISLRDVRDIIIVLLCLLRTTAVYMRVV
jgi:hypothetical protein